MIYLFCVWCFSWNSTFSGLGIDDQEYIEDSSGLVNPTNLTGIEELSPISNITNSTIFIITTMRDSTVPQELEIASFAIFTISSTVGCFLFFNVRRYLKTKAPGTKTILDEFYANLFSYWIVEAAITGVDYFQATMLKEIDNLWLMAVIVVSTNYLIVLLSFFHLLVCMVCNITLIYAPHITDELDDKFAITLTT